MPARTIKRPKTAPDTPNLNLQAEQETEVAQARRNFKNILNRNRRGALDIIKGIPLEVLYEVGSDQMSVCSGS